MNKVKKASFARRILTPLAGVAIAASLVTGAISTAGASTNSLVAAANKVLAKYEVRPTTLPSFPVITKKIPHKSIVFVTCGDSGPCGAEPAVLKKFTDHLGWSLTTIVVAGTAGTPTQVANMQTAMAQAVSDHPFAIVTSAWKESLFPASYSQMVSQHILLVNCCSVDTANGNAKGGLIYNIGTPSQSGSVGILMAEMDVAAAPNGVAHVANWDLGGVYPILAAVYPTMAHTLTHISPHSTSVDVPFDGSGPAQMVAYLQGHRAINEIDLSTDGIITGLPEALQAAGLSHRVKIIGEGGTVANGQFIYTGQQFGTTSFDFVGYFGFMVNALVQAATGHKVLPSQGTPHWVYVKSNVPNLMLAGSGVFPIEKDAYQQFFAHWK